jgi:hypothetical protein
MYVVLIVDGDDAYTLGGLKRLIVDSLGNR